MTKIQGVSNSKRFQSDWSESMWPAWKSGNHQKKSKKKSDIKHVPA